MKYIIKGIIAAYIILNYFIANSIGTIELVLLFALFTVTLLFDIKNRTFLPYVFVLECIVIFLIGIYTEYTFYALLILAFDIMCMDMYYFWIMLAGFFCVF